MSYILLILGFVLLIKGADYFVEGSSNLAKCLRIPTLIIGLTIVSIGTSSPEVMVSLIASLRGSSDLSISNVVGSNIFNLLVVLGASSVIKNLTTRSQVLTRDFIISIVATIMVIVFMIDRLFNDYLNNVINRSEGFILLLAFALYIYTMIMFSRKRRHVIKEYHSLTKVDIFMLLSGFLAVVLGGELVVKSSREIAISLGITETLVGLTLVSIGTSLPELITSLVAAKKGEADIAIGNVIGSNICNFLLVMGLTSFIKPLLVDFKSIIDVIILLIISIFIYLIMLIKKKITLKTGLILLFLYLLFMIYIIGR